MADFVNNTEKKFEILNQFIKDLSFEAPNSPRIFFEKIEEKPNVEVGFEIKSIPAGEHLFEVNLHLTVRNALKDRVLYFIELSYSAMTVLNKENVPEENTDILLKQVPSYLFPFVRGVVADLTKESGFPPFILAPIDFSKVEVQQQPKEEQPANENK
ncbi:MAG: protein-export chaperone SecB [Alphaproteobacteria bacterium]|nr:protein-export chaperone SecB [Alphaproteobacteria bacterium]